MKRKWEKIEKLKLYFWHTQLFETLLTIKFEICVAVPLDYASKKIFVYKFNYDLKQLLKQALILLKAKTLYNLDKICSLAALVKWFPF